MAYGRRPYFHAFGLFSEYVNKRVMDFTILAEAKFIHEPSKVECLVCNTCVYCLLSAENRLDCIGKDKVSKNNIALNYYFMYKISIQGQTSAELI